MLSRYIVRRGQGDLRYSVWDNEQNTVAVHNGRRCEDLDMDEAFDAADFLNAGDTRSDDRT